MDDKVSYSALRIIPLWTGSIATRCAGYLLWEDMIWGTGHWLQVRTVIERISMDQGFADTIKRSYCNSLPSCSKNVVMVDVSATPKWPSWWRSDISITITWGGRLESNMHAPTCLVMVLLNTSLGSVGQGLFLRWGTGILESDPARALKFPRLMSKTSSITLFHYNWIVCFVSMLCWICWLTINPEVNVSFWNQTEPW